MSKINVEGSEISIIAIDNRDYISLTDMVRNIENGSALIEKWLRNKNTIEFLGIWEEMYNTSFNSPEFEGIKNEAGFNRFILSVKQWVEKTNSIGIVARAGRYGGTYAHKDIAFEFASWVSPYFKLYLIKEFERLKEEEQKKLGWDIKRNLAKINYRIHNLKGNIRDYADISQLVCLSNLENLNAVFINEGMSQSERLEKLNSIAIEQMKILSESESIKKLK